MRVIYLIHMNQMVWETAGAVLGGDERIRIIEPLNVLDFHNFMARSYLILTDPGGTQGETEGSQCPLPALYRKVLACFVMPAIARTAFPDGLPSGRRINLDLVRCLMQDKRDLKG